MTASSVHAQVRYLNSEWRDSEELARIGSRDSRRANTTPTGVDIFDARPESVRGELDLDTNGFVLSELNSAVTNFRDENEVKATYYPEVQAHVKELAGADHVFMMQHLIRTESKDSFNTAYARFIHCDYSNTDVSNMARSMLERNALDPALADQWDFAWFNVWQPFDREVQQNPLTLIDVTSLEQADIVDYFYTGYGKDSAGGVKAIRPSGDRSVGG